MFSEVGRRFWTTFEVRDLPFHMPLYPIVTGVLGPIGTTVFDIGISLTTVILIHILTIQICQDRLAAIFASFIAASYPLFVFYSATGLAETLFVTLVVAAFVCWFAKHFALAALFSVLEILTRPLFELVAPIMIVCFSLIVFRESFRSAIKHIFVYAAIYCILMAPWWVNNYRIYGEFVRLVPMSAAVFYIGNNPMNKTGAQTPNVDFDRRRIYVDEKEMLATNAKLRSEALTFIKENPAQFVELAVKKALILWRPWPIAEEFNSSVYFWTNLLTSGPIMILAIFGIGMLTKDERRRCIPIFAYIAIYTAIIMVLASATRYRMPLEPFLFVFAALPIAKFMRWMERLRPTFAPASGQ